MKLNRYCEQYYKKKLKESSLYWLKKNNSENIDFIKQIYFTEENLLKFHIKKSDFIVDFETIQENHKCLFLCCMIFVHNKEIQYYILLDITNNRNIVFCRNKKTIQIKPSIKTYSLIKTYSKKYNYHTYRTCKFYNNFYNINFVDNNYVHWLDKMF